MDMVWGKATAAKRSVAARGRAIRGCMGAPGVGELRIAVWVGFAKGMTWGGVG
jgi:hypothetical protein